MKKLATVVETGTSGLEQVLGERVLLMCSGFFYLGTLTGVNDSSVCLEDAVIVYDILWDKKDHSKESPLQKLPSKEWFVSVAAIESFGVVQP